MDIVVVTASRRSRAVAATLYGWHVPAFLLDFFSLRVLKALRVFGLELMYGGLTDEMKRILSVAGGMYMKSCVHSAVSQNGSRAASVPYERFRILLVGHGSELCSDTTLALMRTFLRRGTIPNRFIRSENSAVDLHGNFCQVARFLLWGNVAFSPENINIVIVGEPSRVNAMEKMWRSIFRATYETFGTMCGKSGKTKISFTIFPVAPPKKNSGVMVAIGRLRSLIWEYSSQGFTQTQENEG